MTAQFKPGDSVTVSRDGKVFVAQYTSVSGFASITRVLSDDVDADLKEMHELADRMWHDSVVANFENANAAYAALGTQGDVDQMMVHVRSRATKAAATTVKKKRKVT